MGWGSGTEVMSNIIYGIKKEIEDEGIRETIYKIVIEALEDHDWDNQYECLGEDKSFDKALKSLHPKWEF